MVRRGDTGPRALGDEGAVATAAAFRSIGRGP